MSKQKKCNVVLSLTEQILILDTQEVRQYILTNKDHTHIVFFVFAFVTSYSSAAPTDRL